MRQSLHNVYETTVWLQQYRKTLNIHSKTLLQLISIHYFENNKSCFIKKTVSGKLIGLQLVVLYVYESGDLLSDISNANKKTKLFLYLFAVRRSF